MTLVGNAMTTAWNKTGGSMQTWLELICRTHWGTNRVLMVWIGIFCCSCSYNLHHLCGSPSYSLGSRDESLSPTRILGIELLNGCCTLNRKNQCSQTCLLSILENHLIFKKVKKNKAGSFLNLEQWLTLPPSTISFCKSVEAIINIRIACRTENTTEKEKHTFSLDSNQHKNRSWIWSALVLQSYYFFTYSSLLPSSSLCSCWESWKNIIQYALSDKSLANTDCRMIWAMAWTFRRD